MQLEEQMHMTVQSQEQKVSKELFDFIKVID